MNCIQRGKEVLLKLCAAASLEPLKVCSGSNNFEKHWGKAKKMRGKQPFPNQKAKKRKTPSTFASALLAFPLFKVKTLKKYQKIIAIFILQLVIMVFSASISSPGKKY